MRKKSLLLRHTGCGAHSWYNGEDFTCATLHSHFFCRCVKGQQSSHNESYPSGVREGFDGEVEAAPISHCFHVVRWIINIPQKRKRETVDVASRLTIISLHLYLKNLLFSGRIDDGRHVVTHSEAAGQLRTTGWGHDIDNIL